MENSTHYAIKRIEHGAELFSISEEELTLIITPYRRLYDPESLEELPESEKGFETGIHGASDLLYSGDVDAEYTFSINLEHECRSLEEYTDVVYKHLKSSIEEEYSEADVIAPEPFILNHFMEDSESDLPI